MNEYLKIFQKVAVMLIFPGLALGCASTPVKNVDIEPPVRGLLVMAQQENQTALDDRGYQVSIQTSNGKAFTSGQSELSLQVLDSKGNKVLRFREDMTKLMHVIIVSEDLSSFQHVHPVHQKDGEFIASVDFPFAGRYLITSEFKPNREGVTVVQQWIDVAGVTQPSESIMPDSTYMKNIDGLEVSLSASPAVGRIKAGQIVMLLFRLADEQTGEPVKKVEPYLGTSGHCVIINSTADQFVHAHAAEGMSGGANIMFHTAFPEKGIYKIWGQFQVDGAVITVPFVVKVE